MCGDGVDDIAMVGGTASCSVGIETMARFRRGVYRGMFRGIGTVADGCDDSGGSFDIEVEGGE